MATTFDTVRIYDPAIDWSRSACKAVDYARDRDASKLVARDGHQMTVFRYQRLTRSQWLSFVSRGTSDEDKAVRAFQCGVREISLPSSLWRPEGVARPDFVAMGEPELDALEDRFEIGLCDLVEVGTVVMTRSMLPFGYAPRFQVPPLSLGVWAAASRLSAEQSQAGVAQSNTLPEER